MKGPLAKLPLEKLLEMRDAVVFSNSEEDGQMTLGELTTKFDGKVTMRAERAAVLAQLDQAISQHATSGSEKLQ